MDRQAFRVHVLAEVPFRHVHQVHRVRQDRQVHVRWVHHGQVERASCRSLAWDKHPVFQVDLA